MELFPLQTAIYLKEKKKLGYRHGLSQVFHLRCIWRSRAF